MSRPTRHPSTDLARPLEWIRGNPHYNGKLLHYDYVAARLSASERKIEELTRSLESARAQVDP